MHHNFSSPTCAKLCSCHTEAAPCTGGGIQNQPVASSRNPKKQQEHEIRAARGVRGGNGNPDGGKVMTFISTTDRLPGRKAKRRNMTCFCVAAEAG